MSTALIVTDYPIVSRTAHSVLSSTHAVTTLTWGEVALRRPLSADLIVVDVTSLTEAAAMACMCELEPTAAIVACSLHRNEVRVYRAGQHGPEIAAELPSLLAVAP